MLDYSYCNFLRWAYTEKIVKLEKKSTKFFSGLGKGPQKLSNKNKSKKKSARNKYPKIKVFLFLLSNGIVGIVAMGF